MNAKKFLYSNYHPFSLAITQIYYNSFLQINILSSELAFSAQMPWLTKKQKIMLINC